MELKVIGTGSAGNCYVLTDKEGRRLMLEAGVPVISVLQGLDFDTSRLSGIVLTHEHGDHAAFAKAWAKRGQRIYASRGTLDAIADNSLYWQSARVDMEAGILHRIGAYLVKPFPVEHDAREPFGYLVKHSENKVLSVTDACACGVRTKGVNTFLVECNYDLDSLKSSDIPESLKARISNAHFSLAGCKDFLSRQDLTACKRIVVIHASGERLNKERVVEELQKQTGIPVEVAQGGMTIEL